MRSLFLTVPNKVRILQVFFVYKNNTYYVANDIDVAIDSGVEGSSNLTKVATGGHSFFVSDNCDVYAYDSAGSNRVTRWPTGVAVMSVTSYCRGLFVDANNILYCSLYTHHQVLAKQLNDSMNTTIIVAGNDSLGSTSTTLQNPSGIFVDSCSNLFVADTVNNRIQRFSSGERNATTVAGNGAPNTFTLNHPTDVVMDGGGFLFIVDQDSHSIVGSGPGGFQCVAGCMGTHGNASNQLNRPQSMSFDNHGNIWVADMDNHRIQKFVLNVNCTGRYIISSA